eukprot:GSChrysophyteH2.ASY1.ANO1.1411.1 assembled CDS
MQLDKYLACVDYHRKLSSIGGGAHIEPAWVGDGFSAWCAVRIQAWYRGQVVRRRYLYRTRVIMQIAVLIIQSGWRAHKRFVQLKRFEEEEAELKAKKKDITPVRASVIIQLAWRSHCNHRIYSYYRDLVVNKLQGAPQELLRSIIPNESSLLDRAAGVVVRFRLGGAVFPPKVFFKIFTYRGVCDVNAFAPRDYANELPHEAFQKNIHDKFIPKNRMKYNRNIQNNQWRPLASQLFEDVLAPPWMNEGVVEKSPAPFHFSQLKRKTDQIKARKRKKREWLRKAYMLAGALDEGDRLRSTLQLANYQRTHQDNQITEYNVGTSLQRKHPYIHKIEETEDLLQWSMALDFDDYASDWAKIGTSSGSGQDAIY